MSFRLGLVSHQNLLRELLRDHLMRTGSAIEVREFGSVAEALDVSHQIRELDLLVIDPDGMSADPLRSVREVSRRLPRTKIAFVTDTTAGYFAAAAPELGLRGILHKRDRLQSVRPAIEAVLAGGYWQSGHVDRAARANFARVLSPREIEVLRLIALGRSAREIAKRLRVAPATVVTHRKNCMRKLGLGSAHALLAFAWRAGLVSFEQLGLAKNGAN